MLYGLIGRKLGHSFSARYFNEKFKNECIPARYELYEIDSIIGMPMLVNANPDLYGLNVTIPYKQQALGFMSSLTPTARAIGAVNTVRIERCREPYLTTGTTGINPRFVGHNTDAPGFREALEEFLSGSEPLKSFKALILGTGGASKAVKYALDELGMDSLFVSRNTSDDAICYSDLTEDIIGSHLLIINCTPLGMWPDVESCPPIQYEWLTDRHFCFDLVYNPDVTEFMKRSSAQGARTCNGLKMLYNQARLSWEFWQTPVIKRYLSRKIEVHHSDGHVDTYPLSIAEVSYSPEGKAKLMKVMPYKEEMPSVIYLDIPLIFELE